MCGCVRVGKCVHTYISVLFHVRKYSMHIQYVLQFYSWVPSIVAQWAKGLPSLNKIT